MALRLFQGARAVCGVLFLGAAMAAHADSQSPKGDESRCDGNQQTLNDCSQRRLKAVEQRMKKSFDDLLERVRGTDSERELTESQDLWFKFREADCRYDISGLTPDGSMVEQVRNDCRARHTKERVKQLEAYLQCTSAGCPGE
jgi:uncharacterized protein YecT (DUF1311 family)